MFFSESTVEYIGTELGPRPDLARAGLRGIIWFENMHFSNGVITSFHAYVLEHYPIRFQIWRRASDNGFTLVGEKRAVPSDPLGMLEVRVYSWQVSLNRHDIASC